MKVIDMRVRPPYKSFKDMKIFSYGLNDYPTPGRFNMKRPKSGMYNSMEMFLEEIKEAGIVKAAVPVRLHDGVKNEDVVSLKNEYPDLVLAFPEVDPWKGEAALKEIDELVTNGPCTGIMLEPGYNVKRPLYADDKIFYPIYEKCERQNIPLLLSFGGYIGDDLSFNDPDRIWRITADFPNLKIGLCHAAWPFTKEIIYVAFRRPNLYLVPDMYAYGIPGGNDYIVAANSMLKDQIMFGSAYGIFDLKNAVEQYMNCGLSEEVLPKVMYENAARFLNLEI